MNIHEYNPARKVYLTDEEDILTACAVGVYRPTLRVHLPFGKSYCELTALERSTLWAFERFLQSGELEHMTGAWIFRGIEPEFSGADSRNLDLVGFRVVIADDGYDDYDDLLFSAGTYEPGWTKFLHIPASTALAA